jgi:prepilin-type N-terminal cleavage/methylation domain-containing protein
VLVNFEKESIGMDRLRQRLAREEGFTLIELLVVLVIIAILMAIAVPSYLGFKDRANQRAASADVREAVPSVEAFYSDHQTYTGVTVASLKQIDSGLSAAVGVGVIAAGGYCLDATVGGKTSYFVGPGGTMQEGGAKPNAACP